MATAAKGALEAVQTAAAAVEWSGIVAATLYTPSVQHRSQNTNHFALPEIGLSTTFNQQHVAKVYRNCHCCCCCGTVDWMVQGFK